MDLYFLMKDIFRCQIYEIFIRFMFVESWDDDDIILPCFAEYMIS